MTSWTIPFPQRSDRGRGRKKHGGRGRGSKQRGSQAAAAAVAAPPRPSWDSTSSDLDKFRLTPAEMAYRQSLRRHSRHRHRGLTHPAACEEHQHGEKLLEAPADMQPEQDEAAGLEAVQKASEERWTDEDIASGAASPLAGCPLDGNASEDDDVASLSGMQDFVAQLQRKYGLAGPPGVQHPQSPAPTKPSTAQQKLAQLRAAQAQAAGVGSAGEDGSSGSDGGGCPLAGDRRRCSYSPALAATWEAEEASSPAPAAALHGDPGSDSEGEGHLGPAALRRAKQRAMAAAAAAGAEGLEQRASGAGSAAWLQSANTMGAAPTATACTAQHSAALEARLAAAEGQLARLCGVEEQLVQTRQSVARLESQNERLQTDLNDFVSHTSTLLTSLQGQLSSFLAAAGGSSGGGGSGTPVGATPAGQRYQQYSSPQLPHGAVSTAVVQARAAAEALAIAHQARTHADTARAHADAAAAVAAGAPASRPLPPVLQAAAAAAAQTRSQPSGPAPSWQQQQQQQQPCMPSPARCTPSPVQQQQQQQQQQAAGDVLANVQLPTFRRFAALRLATAGPKPLAPAPARQPPAETVAEAPPIASDWGLSARENSPPERLQG